MLLSYSAVTFDWSERGAMAAICVALHLNSSQPCQAEEQKFHFYSYTKKSKERTRIILSHAEAHQPK